MPVPRKKLACADFTFPALPHELALDLIAGLGCAAVDIGFFEGRGHLQPGRELRQTRRSAARLRRQLEQRGLALADLFLIPGSNFGELAPNHPDSAVRRNARRQFERTVEYALLAGGRHVSGLPGIAWKQESRGDSFRRSADELVWRVDHARRHGVTYSIEPHIGSIVPRPRDVLKLLAATPGLTLTLDYGHFTRQGIPDATVEPLIAHASHFHARAGRRGRLQVPLEENTIDFRRILAVMKRTGYRGYLTLEYVWSEWEQCNQTDNLTETVRLRDLLLSAT